MFGCKSRAAARAPIFESLLPSLSRAALGQLAPQELDRYGPVQGPVIAAKNHTCGAKGKPLLNTVTTDGKRPIHLVTLLTADRAIDGR
jgi:hypothetical protein